MNCFDCAALGDHVDAAAICAYCGAAVCHYYAHVTARWLTRTMVINRVVAVEPPARTIRCGIRQAAATRRRTPATRRPAKQRHKAPPPSQAAWLQSGFPDAASHDRSGRSAR